LGVTTYLSYVNIFAPIICSVERAELSYGARSMPYSNIFEAARPSSVSSSDWLGAAITTKTHIDLLFQPYQEYPQISFLIPLTILLSIQPLLAYRGESNLLTLMI